MNATGWASANWQARDLWRPVLPLLALQVLMWFDLLRPGTLLGAIAALLLTAGMLALMIVYPLWAFRRRGGRWSGERPDAGRVAIEATLAVPFLLLAYGVMMATSYGLEALSGEPLGTAPELEESVRGATSWRLPLLALLACVAAPVSEELFFRGFLYNALAQRRGPLVAALGQGLIFMILHPYGARHLVLVFVLGMVLLGVYRLRGTLLAPIFVHALFNGVALLATVALLAQPRPMLGIQFEPGAEACVVREVLPDSPAAEAGIEPGDTITAIDGETVESFADLLAVLRAKEIGECVSLEIVRDGETLSFEVELASSENFEE